MTGNVLKALVVDDETLARARMRTLLSDCKAPTVYCVGEAGNAVQAMEMLQHQVVDVALIDIHMPGADGLMLARSLQSLPQAPALIFVTAHTEHAVQAPIDRHVLADMSTGPTHGGPVVPVRGRAAVRSDPLS